MNAIATRSSLRSSAAEREARSTIGAAGPTPAGAEAATLRVELGRLRARLGDASKALARAEERARRAERRLRSRLLELTWPAALAGLAGGFAGIVALRLAGV